MFAKRGVIAAPCILLQRLCTIPELRVLSQRAYMLFDLGAGLEGRRVGVQRQPLHGTSQTCGHMGRVPSAVSTRGRGVLPPKAVGRHAIQIFDAGVVGCTSWAADRARYM